MECISIPECTQRLSHLIYGGQHGQESEEGEEGKVGSEEDCQEDPQGRQEEEVRLLLTLLPASRRQRHKSRYDFCPAVIFSSSRRKRVSARHQARRSETWA